MKRILCRQRGFTLVEVLVSVSILIVITSILGAAMFQALATEKGVVDDGHAINELRKGLSWFAEDVKRAKEADVTAGVLTLTWTDEYEADGTIHTLTYERVGDTLVRTLDGSAHTVSRRVLTSSFSITIRTVTAQIEVQVNAETTRTLSVNSVMRPAAS